MFGGYNGELLCKNKLAFICMKYECVDFYNAVVDGRFRM